VYDTVKNDSTEFFGREGIVMRKYPYTETTDLILYEAKAKKTKKPKIWTACLCSALVASIFTGGLVASGMYLLNSNKVKMYNNSGAGIQSGLPR
jgi:hypothetical protein